MRVPLLHVTAPVLALVLALAGCSEPAQDRKGRAPGDAAPAASEEIPPEAPPDPQALALSNRGVGLMGQFRYAEAREVFAALAQRYPDWAQARVNLAIATLNRQEEGDEEAALERVDEVLATDPGHLRAHYVAGLLELYLGRPEAALEHFRTVAQADPQDAYAAYYLGQVLAQQGSHEQALAWYRRAMDADPYLRSAYYGAFQALRRLRRTDQARSVMADYQRLADNPRARLAEFKYTRMGPKAEALSVQAQGPEPARASPPGPLFQQPQPLPGGPAPAAAADRPVSLTVADVDADGAPDLFLAAAHAGTELLLGDGEGGFSAAPAHPLAGLEDVNAALWGDVDNDGRLDVYLCRRGPNQLWLQTPGGWTEAAQGSGTAGAGGDTRAGALLDADHDGDLDIFLVNADGPNELLSSNRDGTFRPLARERGLEGTRRSLQVLPVDLDADRDVDLVVLNAQGPHEVYLNDRLWDYRSAPGMDAFRQAPALAAVAGDVDADGRMEIYTVDPRGSLRRWQRGPEGAWAPRLLGQAPGIGEGWTQLALEDVDGDGVQELLAAGPAGWAALRVAGEQAQVLHRSRSAVTAVAPVLLRPGQGPAVAGTRVQGAPLLWSAGPGRHDFLAIAPSGREDAGQSMRSNASGIGTRLTLRTETRFSVAHTLGRRSGPGQDHQPLALGLGGDAQADYLALDWSDGVFQTELDLPAGRVHRIAETQRQLSSCPVLFAWDGQRHAFVTDLLGVGGIGYAVGPGQYAPPRPWEHLLLPAGLLQPRQGRYVLKLTEPMEEAAYIDAVGLAAYDLPPGWGMSVDERMSVAGPEPTGRALFFRRELAPVQAVDHSLGDVGASLAAADGRAAPVGDLDERFIGRLAGERVLTLEFGQALDEAPGEPWLVASGWVEYPYSQTMFAAWQAGARFDAPTLQARGADGVWRTLLAQFGYPAGMPREMAVPLPELPPGATALRLRGNMEVYWDRIRVVYSEPAPEVVRRELALVAARLARTGFARRTTGAQRRPHYDYRERATFWDARHMPGRYTRYGPVLPLVEALDDALAIFGPGEELHLELAAPGQAPPAGWTRRLVLEAHGWAKDMDLYTRDGDTLGPLPDAGRDPAARERLHVRFNTRWREGS